MKELFYIQQRLVAKKDKFNGYGKYNYRSAEGILESLKPLLNEQNCILTLSDKVEVKGNRYYVIATATLSNSEGVAVTATAEAREEETKKGMDAAQITGAASSYARKYALCGLFAIDDGVDPDMTNTHDKVDLNSQIPTSPMPDDRVIQDIKAKVRETDSVDELKQLFARLKETAQHPEITKLFTERKQALKNGQA